MESQSSIDSAQTTVQKPEERKSEDIDVRIAVIGNVDSGKSTLVGVLTRCVVDDGRG